MNLQQYRPEQLAKEAYRLLNDEFLAYAINETKQYAIGKLVDANPGDTVKVTQCQEQIKALEELQTTLTSYIQRDDLDSEDL